MNDRKIAFIICVNNEIYYEECCYYINQLTVPEGFEIDVLAIREADSMCAAYNLGMQSTDAKYKIYMHQDVFIRNRDFLYEVISRFETNPQVGMIGMLGGNGMPQNAMTYLAWNVGAVDCRDVDLSYYLLNEIKDTEETKDTVVEAIDGLLMATQYDVPWREDIFTDFDFYDVSGAFEMRKAGYKVLVPHMTTPWVIHDSSFVKLGKYDKNRQLCLKEYPEYFYAENKYEFKWHVEWEALSEQLAFELQALLNQGAWDSVRAMIESYRTREMKNSKLEMIGIMTDIREAEKKKNILTGFFDGAECWTDIYERYIRMRFALRRLELGYENARCGVIRDMIERGQLSYEVICVMIIPAVVDKYGVLTQIVEIYKELGMNKELERAESLLAVLKKRPLAVARCKGA